jgi:hypothetical protein
LLDILKNPSGALYGFTLAAAERDDELIHAWLRNDWLQLKKRGGSAQRSFFMARPGVR